MKVALIVDNEQSSASRAQEITQALQQNSHEAVVYTADASLADRLLAGNCDVAFVACAGVSGQAGEVQALLDLLGIPYAGSYAEVCRLVADHALVSAQIAALCMSADGYGTVGLPEGFFLSATALQAWGVQDVLQVCNERIPGGFPLCVKPITPCDTAPACMVVESEEALCAAVDALAKQGCGAFVQQWVEGVNVSVSVLGSGWDAYALPPVEVERASLAASTSSAGEPSEMYAPLRWQSVAGNEAEGQGVRADIERAALDVYRALGLKDFGQVDLVWDGAQACIVGVSACPDLTSGSLFAKASSVPGISLAGILDNVIYQ